MSLLKGMLAISAGPGLDAAERRRLVEQGSHALSTVTGAEVHVTDKGGSLTVLTAGATPAPDDGFALVPGSFEISQGARDQVPPFGACLPGPGPDEISVATDAHGIRHIHLVEEAAWSAVSTSSLALSTMSGRGMDVPAISHYALVGAYHGTETPFTGVRKLGPGRSVRLSAGRAKLTSYVPTGSDLTELDHRDLVTAGADAVSTAVEAALDRFPDAAVELSGGLDSRMVLAGIPRSQRLDRDAVTLGVPGTPDWVLAGDIARSEGMHHTLVDLRGLAEMGPDEVTELVRVATLRRDCSGNALAFGVLDWVEKQFGPGPRLTGQNGEFARGFYYPGQPNWRAVNKPLIAALGRWRIFTNDPVDPDLFAADLRQDRQSWAMERLYESIPRHEGGWLNAVDEYYLHERMRNWLGAEWSASSMDRPLLAPFFHSDYVAWARSCPPAQKRSSRIFCRVLGALDERLATIPSTSGTSPSMLGRSGPRSTVHRSAALTGKVIAKSRQRISRHGKPATGAADLTDAIRQVWSKNPAALDAVSALDFLDRKTVADIAAGQRQASPATVSFLLDLSVMLELIDR